MLKLVSGTAYFTGWASVSEAIGLVKGHMIQQDEIQLLISNCPSQCVTLKTVIVTKLLEGTNTGTCVFVKPINSHFYCELSRNNLPV